MNQIVQNAHESYRSSRIIIQYSVIYIINMEITFKNA